MKLINKIIDQHLKLNLESDNNDWRQGYNKALDDVKDILETAEMLE